MRYDKKPVLLECPTFQKTLAGEEQLQGWGGEVWAEQSFLKDDGEGAQPGGTSAGQWGGNPVVEHLQVPTTWVFGKLPRFETAWNLDEDSPWCAVFESDDLAVFEFREDLKYFYK